MTIDTRRIAIAAALLTATTSGAFAQTAPSATAPGANQIQADAAAEAEKEAEAEAKVETVAPPPAPAPTVATSWSGGSPRTTEEDRIFKINGRVQFDVSTIDADGADLNQHFGRSSVRRALIGVEGQFTKNWKYNVKYQIVPGAGEATSAVTTRRLCQAAAGAIVQRTACITGETDRGPVVTAVSTSGGADDAGFDDAFIQYVVSDWEFTLGNNNRVAPMEDVTSSLNIPFNERSAMINAFGFTKLMGLSVLKSGGNWSAGIALQGDELNNVDTVNVGETIGSTVRATWAPIYDRQPDGVTLIHLGLSARYRDNAGGPSLSGLRGPGFRYRARPQTGFGDRFIDTGSIAFAQDVFYGAEFAAQRNQFSVAGEYGQLKARPQSGTVLGAFEPTFTGGYFDFFWSPTGESRNYNAKDGSFGRTAPLRTLGSDGGIGAVTLGARYDYLDLTDGPMDGGGQKGVTLQATWQPLSFLKLQTDYSILDIERPGGPLTADANIVTIRTQVEW